MAMSKSMLGKIGPGSARPSYTDNTKTLCGVLGVHKNNRYLMDEPGWEYFENSSEFNPWYAPIEDEE